MNDTAAMLINFWVAHGGEVIMALIFTTAAFGMAYIFVAEVRDWVERRGGRSRGE